jgi:hypothetical protein
MRETAGAIQTLPVFPSAEICYALCVQCGQRPAKMKYCSSACRQRAYYNRKAAPARARKLENYFRKNRSRSLGFDGRYGGPAMPGFAPKAA